MPIINEIRKLLAEKEFVLVGISGIDGSGKGFHAKRLKKQLHQAGIKATIVTVDGWLTHPDRRISTVNQGENFYQNGVDFVRFKRELFDPLETENRVDLVSQQYDATYSGELTERRYRIQDVNVAIIEGIFLFRRDVQLDFDFKVWIDSSKEVALRRAMERNQEGLAPEKVKQDFEAIYFPAQDIHFAKDDPVRQADLIIDNNRDLVR